MISIIVPIYNVEKYLVECLDSILNQSYEDFEVLMIDDGSTDNCPCICDEFEKKDSRFKAYHKKNGGLSDARNYGIQRVKGEWFTFIDGDDKVGHDFLSHFKIDDLDPEIDHIVCNGYSANGKPKEFWTESNILYNQDSLLDFIRHVTNSKGLFLSTWSRLYKTDIIKNHSIYSPSGFHYAEDCCMNFEYYKYISKISIVQDNTYFYRENPNSLSRTSKPYIHYIKCLDIMIEHYKYYTKKYNNNFILNDYFVGFHVVGNTLSIIDDLYSNKYSKIERKQAYEKIKLYKLETNGIYKYYVNKPYSIMVKFLLLKLPFFFFDFIYKAIKIIR